MAKSESYLGIEITQTELRIVEVVGGHDTGVRATATVPLPPGSLNMGAIVDPDSMSRTLANAVEQNGFDSRSAIIGMPTAAYSTRVLEIPPVPESELPTVIEGEVIYFRILREGTGGFDFIHMAPMAGKPESHVLLAAVEDEVLEGYRQTVLKAGLRLVAIEPFAVASVRAGVSFARERVAALIVALDTDKSEVAIVGRQGIAVFRRLDIGERQVFGDGSGPEPLDEAGLQILLADIRRSIEYYEREWPSDPTVSAIVLSGSHSKVEALREWLQGHLQTPVTVSTPPGASPKDAVAYGLALGTTPRSPIKSMDLSGRQRVRSEARRARRAVYTAAAAAGVILIAGLGATFFLSRNVAHETQLLANRHKELDFLQNVALPEADARTARLQLLSNLAREGSPVPVIVDAISASLDPGSSLREVHLDSNFRLRIVGEAVNELSMINTLESVRNAQGFRNTTVDSFDRDNENLVRFQISSTVNVSSGGGSR